MDFSKSILKQYDTNIEYNIIIRTYLTSIFVLSQDSVIFKLMHSLLKKEHSVLNLN